jgi:spermidine synthase
VYRDAMADRRRDVKILFYEDAADATVSIEQGDIGQTNKQIKLRINGKVDASSHGDLSTQYLLAHLPLLAKPDSKEVFVFGMGSGITAGAALAFPINHVTVAENCEPVLRAAEFFNPWNRGVLTDKRTRLRREDARTVLKLNAEKFDVIISEPSNPWMAGVGSVFSQEFYQLAANKLSDDGIMVQWFHVYEMHDGIAMLVLRTFGTVFPHMEVWDTSEGDIILLGSKQPWASQPDVWKKSFALGEVKDALAAIGIESPEGVWARQFASQRTAPAIAGPGAIQRDDFPVLEYDAPRAFYLGQSARALFDFDERTWQTPLMPAAKRAALAGLKVDALRKIFDKGYSSVNVHLQSALRTRFAGDNFGYLQDGRPMPDAFSADVPVALDDPAQAVRAALQRGEAVEARRLLLAALEKNPRYEQLRFLARIMIREGSVQLADVVEFLSVN